MYKFLHFIIFVDVFTSLQEVIMFVFYIKFSQESFSSKSKTDSKILQHMNKVSRCFTFI